MSESLLGTVWQIVPPYRAEDAWTEILLSCSLGQDIPLPRGIDHRFGMYRNHCRYFQVLLTYASGRQEIRWIECYYYEIDHEDARKRVV